MEVAFILTVCYDGYNDLLFTFVGSPGLALSPLLVVS